MIQQIEIKGNRVQNDLQLFDGEYTIIVLSNKERTRKEWVEYYFAIIDEFSLCSGNSRYTIHDLFKVHHNISSTKELDDNTWPLCINELKKFCLLNG